MLRVGTRRALLASAAAVGVVAHEPARDKLSIYPAPEQQIVLVDAPSELEKQIGVVRRHVTATYDDAYARVQGVVSQWIGVEQSVEKRVKSLAAVDEPLTPGILYVAVATLTGSVLARNRSILARVILPPTLLVLSARHFLPRTAHNVSSYLGELEDTYVPAFAQKHDVAKAHSAMTWERAKDATASGRARAEAALVSALGQVQDVTGLKLKEALGLGKEAGKEAEAKAHGVLAAVKERAVLAEGQAKGVADGIVQAVKEKAAVAEKEGAKKVGEVEKKVGEIEKKVEAKRLV